MINIFSTYILSKLNMVCKLKVEDIDHFSYKNDGRLQGFF